MKVVIREGKECRCRLCRRGVEFMSSGFKVACGEFFIKRKNENGY